MLLVLVANDDLCDKTPDFTDCGMTGKQHELEPRSWTFSVAPGSPLGFSVADNRIHLT